MYSKFQLVLWYFFVNFATCIYAEIYAIKFTSQFYFEEFEDRPASFGPTLDKGTIKGVLVPAYPVSGCTNVTPPPPDENDTGRWVLLVPRYTLDGPNCTFEQKVRFAQSAGYDAVIVYNIDSNQLITMYANNETGIQTPSVFVGEKTGLKLRDIYANPNYFVVITAEVPFNMGNLIIPFAIVVGVCFIILIIFMVVKFIKDRRRQMRHRLSTSALNKLPTSNFQKGDPYDTCAICLDDYVEGEKLRVLPCNHVYHMKCIDPWLTKNRRVCPICKRKIFGKDEPHDNNSDSDSDAATDDTTPLINSSNRGTQGGTFEPQTENPLQRAARSISQQTDTSNLLIGTDRHSINGEYASFDDASTSSSELSRGGKFGNSDNFQDTLEVQVHPNRDTESCDSSPPDGSDVKV